MSGRLDAVDRGNAHSRQFRQFGEEQPRQTPQGLAAAKIAAVRGEIDAGQHDLALAGCDELARLATISRGGAERDGPRPNGMMQKVQRWSQPFCTARKPRVPSLAPSAFGAAKLGPAGANRLLSPFPTTRVTPSMAKNSVGAIVAAQPVTMMRASGRSRCRRRMAWRAWRVDSAVTAQVLTMTRFSSPRPAPRRERLGFDDVEPTAESDGVDGGVGHVASLSKMAGSSTVSNSNSTGPVMCA